MKKTFLESNLTGTVCCLLFLKNLQQKVLRSSCRGSGLICFAVWIFIVLFYLLIHFNVWFGFNFIVGCYIHPPPLQSPSFSRVRPEKGPVSGGTRLTVTGRHLDAGSTVTVYIDKEECLFVKSVWIHRRQQIR